MNFTQMHERLRLELLRRIQRGTLSVSLLSRQTGFAQAHMSNFLHGRRQLSLEAVDRVLASQRLDAADLLPATQVGNGLQWTAEDSGIPIVSHAAALFEPFIRPSAIQEILQVPAGVLQACRARASTHHRAWQRFVAVRIPAGDTPPMEPLVFPHAIVLIDRHYNSATPCHPDRANLYAVRHNAHLKLSFVDHIADRLVLRPFNFAFPVELIEMESGSTPSELLVGRVVLIVNSF
jgi:hypothetical protein